MVLALTPTRPFRPNGFYGRHARGWFLNQVSLRDPNLAEDLHQRQGPKPYTISSLQFPDHASRNDHWPVQPGDLCFLRLTSLDTQLTNCILAELLPNLPSKITIKGILFEPLDRAERHDWDSESDYHKLFWGIADKTAFTRVTLEFASPTAFRSQGIDLTLPTPDQVWRSLYWRWQSLAPEELRIDSAWIPFSRSCIVASDFNLQSSKIYFKDGAKGVATGCTGRITYRLLPAKRCGEFASFHQEAAQLLHLLARFALYTGVGHHTTIGMGQTRCVSHGQGRESGRVIGSRYDHIKMG